MAKNKLEPTTLILIIVIGILVIGAFSALFFLPQTKKICGDGICEVTEQTFCNLDCTEECIEDTAIIATRGEEFCSTGWEQAFSDTFEEKNISTDYLRETNEIDYSHPNIQSLANQLKKESAKETAKAIALWTYNNIRYDSSNDFNDCEDIKASEIIERGWGLCSTQSKVNMALLRANGIPARTVTGCFTYTTTCRRIQSFFKFLRTPEIFPIETDASGFVSTRGGLHNFVEIRLPEEPDWVIVESTIGLLYDDTCVNYKKYYTSEEDISPDSPEVCGLPPNDPFVEDCKDFGGR